MESLNPAGMLLVGFAIGFIVFMVLELMVSEFFASWRRWWRGP